MQDYEKSVWFLGTWGRFQRRVFVLLCLMAVPCGYNLLSIIFLLATPPHHCHVPAHWNISQDWIQASIPVQVTGKPERSGCSRYQLDRVQNLSWGGSGPEAVLSTLPQEDCKDGWIYSNEHYQSTIATEFDLVCGDSWKQPFTSVVYFLGGLCGCFISGQLSDRFGRKPVVFGATVVLSVFSCAVASAPSWPVFLGLYFVMGMGQIACYIIVFVLGSEILLGSSRVLFSTLFLPCVSVLSVSLLPVTAYLVRDWRHLSLIMAVPGLACIPLWWQVPESPRWLASRGRWAEAELLLRSAALENGVKPPHSIFHSAGVEEEASKKSLSFLDLLRTSNIRYISLILWVVWFSLSLSTIGLSFNMSNLYGSPHLNYFLATVVEIPAYITSWLLASRFSRRLSFMGFTLLGALALHLILVTPSDLPAITLSLVLLGKYGITVGIAMSYMHTGELSPTVIRNTAMSSCATFSRLGCSVSPYLMQLAAFNEFLPWIVVGSLSLLSVLLYVFLPDTFRKPLPDTIEEMGRIQRLRWPWTSSSSPKDGKSIMNEAIGPEILCTTHL
ncbi:organic cation/carnitine transporter 2-like [Betta splendens]|uniref:Organic cation/carnitine transporter 2-like n=1 Tax=Betta splendens TaxID=158456 RepID=A0A6P7LEK1_BETSP|nr:organic cation/carnitine transporter 2-like [Betta splendens]